ncbi:MAG: metal-dependent transcriptional regulator [Clostridiales bacterium]|jgi:Mn-dependent DtxR family transcriptional regulator|nr:metal-dependent transcriptional regulator [Clostridiales bacterium]
MKKLYESGEDYLETIKILIEQKGIVLSVDIANHMGFSKASVSRAVKILSENGFIIVNKGGSIVFTELGFARASQIHDRHLTIADYLQNVLGVPASVADADACRIEHVISPETFDAIKETVKKER